MCILSNKQIYFKLCTVSAYQLQNHLINIRDAQVNMILYLLFQNSPIDNWVESVIMQPNKNMGKQGEDKNLQQFNKFLKNNSQLLQQKYKQHFIHDKIKISNKQPNPQTVVNFISDVFSFDRTQAEQSNAAHTRDQIQSSLKLSYDTFLKTNKDLKQFNSKVSIQLLKFCILSNQMFAVQYQNSKQSPVQDGQGSKKQKTGNKNIIQRNEPSNQQVSQAKNNQTSHDQNLNQESQNPNNRSNFSVNNQFTLMNGGNSQSSGAHGKQKLRNSFDDGELQNQFNFHEQIKLDLDPIMIKKNLKIIFQYYCKQQMALVPNSSFDRLEKQSHLMTIGKMLLMARMMNMLNSTITKQALISKFRRLSEGKKQIDFKKFDILMSQLQIQDPTIVARAQLNSQNITTHLKTTKKPFDTQDLQPRQLVKNRAFTKKLTVHSGKMQNQLIEDLRLKKQSCILDDRKSSKFSRIKQYYQQISQQAKQRYKNQIQKQKQQQLRNYYIKRKQSQIINPKNLSKLERNYSHDQALVKLKKIIPIEHQDDKWLGEYKINPSSIKKAKNYDESFDKKRSFQAKQRNSILIRDLKNRIKQIERAENETSSFEQTKPYLISPSRRY